MSSDRVRTSQDKFSDKEHFSPVPKIVKGIVIDHCGKTCSEVHREILDAFCEGYVRVTVKYRNGSLETFEFGEYV
jgi:hypothetical protein